MIRLSQTRWISLLGANAALALTFASAAPAQAAPPAGVQRVTSVEGITEYRLANGLQVLLFPDPSKPTITVNITYLVGSRNENYGETGMAHLLEHLMFKGSTAHKNVPQELSEHGASPNGSTSYDRTNYFETFQATDANLNWALDLESDRMIHSFIARKDLDSEMTVVRNEYESGENSPSRILTERVLSTAYLWHNYGKSTIGARSDIEQVPIDRLQAFWRTYYQPDNAVLLVAGKIDPDKTLALINTKFGAIPRPSRVLQPTYTQEPTQDGERSVTLRRVGDVQAVIAAYHVPAGSHPDFPAVEILAEILGDTPSGRLHKALVETKKASAVYGFGYQQREPGVLLVGAEVRKQDPLDPVRDTLLKIAEGVAATPPTSEEVERVRARLLSDIDLSLANSGRIGLQLSEWEAMGDWRLLFLHRDQLKKVTREDVQRVAAAYLKPSNRTLGLFLPTDKPDRSDVPPAPDVAALLKNFKGSAALAEGEAFNPFPNVIDLRTQRSTVGGLKLALLPKKTRGQTVTAQLTLRFGDAQSLMNRSTAADLAGSMLMRGTTQHTRQQIQDQMDRLKAHIDVSGTATQATATITTTHDSLPDALKLAAEILRKPAFPASEFEPLKQEELSGLEQQKSDPQALAFTAIRRHDSPYPKGDVRYVETPEESVEAIKSTTLDDVQRFYSDFYGASNGELAVVGDFDAPALTRLAGELFSDWKSPHPFARVPRPYQEIEPVDRAIETPDKANSFFIASLPLQMKDNDPDYAALALGNYMLGGGFLNSRLATRIRQKEGLSYGVGSVLQVGALDNSAMMMGYAISAPQNTAKVEAAFKEEIARALKDGFTPEEVTAAKSGYLQQLQVRRAQDSALAGQLGQYQFLGRTFAYDADLESKVNSLTPEQIAAAMRKHLDPARMTAYKAGDFSGAAKKTAAPK